MKQAKLLLLLIVVLAFASCGSDEPRYADPEAHEKTVKLNEQYGPLMVGTWPTPAPSPSHTPTPPPSASKAITSKTPTVGSTTSAAQSNPGSETAFNQKQ